MRDMPMKTFKEQFDIHGFDMPSDADERPITFDDLIYFIALDETRYVLKAREGEIEDVYRTIMRFFGQPVFDDICRTGARWELIMDSYWTTREKYYIDKHDIYHILY